MIEKTPLVEMQDIVKHFGSVIALNGVSLTVYPGEVMCLLGDNGAGKSTLIKSLSGVYKPTRGKIYVEGTEVEFNSPRDAQAAGIATVYQDLAMIPLMISFVGGRAEKGLGPARALGYSLVFVLGLN